MIAAIGKQGMVRLHLSHLEDGKTAATRGDLLVMLERGCIRCGAPPQPEPTDEERQRLFDDLEYSWLPPAGAYIFSGFGLVGGGYGPYVCCDGCGFFLKHDLGPEAE